MTHRASTFLCAACLCWTTGCAEFNLQNLRFQSPDEKRLERVKEALNGDEGHSRLIGDYIQVTGLNAIVLEGVGLITGLANTGDDPASSPYRTALIDDMRKRNVEDPNQVLRDPSTTLVLVRAALPPLIRKGDRFDVEVRLPDGSEAASLRGGMLMECELSEQAFVPGRGTLKGKRLAIARGPLLVAAGDGDHGDDDGSNTVLRRAVLPGGAVYLGEDRNLAVFLRGDYRSIRMSQNVAHRIGQRFHDYDQYGIKRPLADPKTDSRIELVVHSRYRENYPRYLQCIRHIMLKESSVERHLRVQRLRDELQIAETAARAALELEAIGPEAVPVLKAGLAAKSLESRFHAAEALAYLGHSDGVEVLRETAEREPAFRAYALAALTAARGGEAALELQKLLDHDSVETRYGAVRALSTLDPRDPAIQAEDLDGKLLLRVVPTRGEPFVHVTRRRKSEVTVFGADQQFQAPMVAWAGPRFLVKAEPGRAGVTISRFKPGRDVERVETSPRVADVIRELSKLDASYADVVQLLVEADGQHNLAGRIAIDALPRAGRPYQRPVEALASGKPGAETQVGHDDLTPNLFDTARNTAPSGTVDAADATAAADDLGPVGFLVK
jgi:hypothetical protein